MIYPIPPGLYCVPSAVAAITGDDPQSVIIPSLHRHRNDPELLGQIGGVQMHHTEQVLKELGYVCRRPRDSTRHRLDTWAKKSIAYGDRPLLVATGTHCLVIHSGLVHDTFTPVGVPGNKHPYRNHLITYVSLVQQL